MIKANELRIGNFILFSIMPKSADFIETVANVHLIDDCTINPKSYKPIPLTEEWLQKFGFKTVCGLWFLKPIRWEKETGVYLGNSNLDTEIYVDCEYVHQLQNLYFALTGSELEIK